MLGFQILFGNFIKMKGKKSDKTLLSRIEEAEDVLKIQEESKTKCKEIKEEKSVFVTWSKLEIWEQVLSEHESLLPKCEYTTLSELGMTEHVLAEHVVGQECHGCGDVIQQDDAVLGFLSCKILYHKSCTDLTSFHDKHVNILDEVCEVCLGNLSQ